LVYRPQLLFGVLGAFSVASIQQRGTWKALREPRVMVFVAVSVLPAVLYYGHGVVVARHFGWKFAESFRPYLFLHAEFWRGWRDLALAAVGYTMLVGSLLGAALLRAGLARAIIVGLVAGYFAFGLCFNMHIHTHGYYHAQLIPIVAIAAAPLFVAIVERLSLVVLGWHWWLPAASVLVLGAYAGAHEVRDRLSSPTLYESPTIARQIGDVVHHSSRVVFLSRYYGQPLEYHGELAGAYWPRRITYYLERQATDEELSIEERLRRLRFVPEYFVITAFDEYRKNHADLRQYLLSHCVPVAQAPEYLIYGECTSTRSALATPGVANEARQTRGRSSKPLEVR
jgi:hypothetical protein